jgi:hypothetical protein
MKNAKIPTQKQTKPVSHKTRPENKDDMDSRKTKDIMPKLPGENKERKNY